MPFSRTTSTRSWLGRRVSSVSSLDFWHSSVNSVHYRLAHNFALNLTDEHAKWNAKLWRIQYFDVIKRIPCYMNKNDSQFLSVQDAKSIITINSSSVCQYFIKTKEQFKDYFVSLTILEIIFHHFNTSCFPSWMNSLLH